MTTATQTALPLPKPCGRCGKMLYDAESIELGYGHHCSEVIAAEMIQKEIAGCCISDESAKSAAWKILRLIKKSQRGSKHESQT